jgi:hypothetical protein
MYKYKIKVLANGNVDVYCKRTGFLISTWVYLFTADSKETAQEQIDRTRKIENGKVVVTSYEYP